MASRVQARPTPTRQSPPASAADQGLGAEALTRTILAVFRVHGALLRAGDALVADLDLTSARWQVLGAVALAAQPPTAPQIGARMGLTRQAVQKQIDLLVASGLLEGAPNPAHRRSPTWALTPRGRRLYATVAARQRRWATALATGVPAAAWVRTASHLEQLSARLETAVDAV